MSVGFACFLLVFTGIWHALEWLMSGRNRDTLALVPFGIIYIFLGVFIALGGAGWLIILLGILAPLIGLLAAIKNRKTLQVKAWVLWTFIIIDVLIIFCLLPALF